MWDYEREKRDLCSKSKEDIAKIMEERGVSETIKGLNLDGFRK